MKFKQYLEAWYHDNSQYKDGKDYHKKDSKMLYHSGEERREDEREKRNLIADTNIKKIYKKLSNLVDWQVTKDNISAVKAYRGKNQDEVNKLLKELKTIK